MVVDFDFDKCLELLASFNIDTDKCCSYVVAAGAVYASLVVIRDDNTQEYYDVELTDPKGFQDGIRTWLGLEPVDNLQSIQLKVNKDYQATLSTTQYVTKFQFSAGKLNLPASTVERR